MYYIGPDIGVEDIYLSDEVLVPMCQVCDSIKSTVSICCNAHGKSLCHKHYRLLHFVEICGCTDCKEENLPYELKNIGQ